MRAVIYTNLPVPNCNFDPGSVSRTLAEGAAVLKERTSYHSDPMIALVIAAALASNADVTFRIRPLSSELWVLDRLSEWEAEYADPMYVTAYERATGHPLDDVDKQLLKAYASLRSKRSNGATVPVDEAEERRHPLLDGLTSPELQPKEKFTLAFLENDTVEAACHSLDLDGSETLNVINAFARFHARTHELVNHGTVQAAKTKLEELARIADLPHFLEDEAGFYGADMRGAFIVDLLWSPSGSKATVIDNVMLIEVDDAIATSTKSAVEQLGVITHEYGHAFASLRPRAARIEFTSRLLREVGLIRLRHSNFVDEAMQTAVGNIFFVKKSFPNEFDDVQNFYAFESGDRAPAAIDELARALVPYVEKLWGQRDVMASKLLDAAIVEHERLYPPRLVHFAFVADVIGPDKRSTGWFRGLFRTRSLSRTTWDDPTAFVKAATAEPDPARFALITDDVASVHHDAIQRAQLPALPALGKNRWCIVAKRRATGAYDVVVRARGLGDLREALIAMEKSNGIPEKPNCSR